MIRHLVPKEESQRLKKNLSCNNNKTILVLFSLQFLLKEIQKNNLWWFFHVQKQFKKKPIIEIIQVQFFARRSSESGEFDEKIESSSVKVQEIENSVDGGLKKGEIEWSVDDVKEVKEKGKDFVGSECFETQMGLGTVNNKEFVKVKEIGGESLLEAKKKQLLEELEVCSIFKNKTNVDNNVDDFDTNVGISGSLRRFDEAVRRSLKIEVIDDTVLIEPISVTKTGNGGANVAERNGKKNGKQETDGKKTKRPWGRGRVATKGFETSKGKKKVTQVGEAQNRTIHVGEIRNGCETDGDQMKRKYSRVEMVALRFANIVEQ